MPVLRDCFLSKSNQLKENRPEITFFEITSTIHKLCFCINKGQWHLRRTRLPKCISRDMQ